MKLSIIIAAYNGEKYLDKCVISCEEQNIKHDDYEVIIVNDGSTDATRNIAESLAAQYCNIIVINRQNGGLTEARNTGLRAAKGDYIWFIDGDDYIEKNCLCQLLDIIEKETLDILCFNYNLVYPDNHLEEYNPIFEEYNKIYLGEEFLCKLQMPPFFVFRVIYRHRFLKDNNLTFYSGLWYDDIEFMPRAYSLAQKVEYINMHPYNYFQRVGSISKSRHNDRNTIEYLKIADSLYKFTEEHFIKGSNTHTRLMSLTYLSLFASLACYTRRVMPLSVYRKKPYFPLSVEFASNKQKCRVKLANFSLNIYIIWHHNRSRLIRLILKLQNKFSH